MLLKLLSPYFFLIAFVPAQSIAQSLFSTTGGYISGNGFSLSYSLGETLTQQFSGQLTLSNGFQQPNEQSLIILSSKPSSPFILFPNPVKDDGIYIHGLKSGIEYEMVLTSNSGDFLCSRKVSGSIEPHIFNLSYSAGIYYLRILELPRSGIMEIKKIIKL